MNKDGKETKATGVLAAHKRVGKKYVPPMMQIGRFSEVSYVQTILPETIWMGLLNDSLGYMQGLELAVAMAKTAYRAYGSQKFVNFALSSSYSILDEGAKREVIEEADRLGKLGVLRRLLMPLLALYEGCPISFFGPSEEWEGDREALVERMKAAVERHFWKYETPAMVLQANVVYIRGICGGLHYVGEVKPPDLNAIIEAPESEEGKRSASSVRASVLMEFNSETGYVDIGWPASFWNQGLLIDTCELGNEEKHDS